MSSKSKEAAGEFIHTPDKEIINITPKEGTTDISGTAGIKQVTTKHPYLKPGVEILVSKVHAERNKANGWAK